MRYRLRTLAIADQSTHTRIGEDLQQNRIRHPAVNDQRAAHAALYCFQRATNLRQHAAVDRAVGDQVIDLLGGQAGQDCALLVHQAGDVGQQHQLFSFQCFGHFTGHQISVDVVRLAVGADADWRDHRDEIAFDQQVQQVGVDPDHFAHLADIDDFRLGHLRRLTGHGELFRTNQLGVFAGQADGAAAMTVDRVEDVLVQLAAVDHFHHVHGLRVSHAHAIDEVALDRQTLEQIADLRDAAVNHYRVDAHGFHQHDVAGERSEER